MNEDELKQVVTLLNSFGFKFKEANQWVTGVDNSKGEITITYITKLEYIPNIKV